MKLAKSRKDGKYFAAKILKKAEIIKLKQVDHIMNEVNILTQISHPFIVRKLCNVQRLCSTDSLKTNATCI